MSRGSDDGAILLAALLAALPGGGAAWAETRSESDVEAPARTYWVYVCSESEDEVALVRYGAAGLEVVKKIEVGSFPAELEGPHGLAISTSGEHWYVSLAHGRPFGSVHRFRTGSDEWLGETTLGMFPATMAFSEATGLLYVVNLDLHGDMSLGSLSIVEPATMIEVARVETGVMPHGSRLNPEGTRHYSVSMATDELVEVDALRFEVTRRLSLRAESSDRQAARPVVDGIGPTWVTAPNPAGKVYVTGSKTNQIFEVDLSEWRIARTISNTGDGPYNVAVIEGMGLLVATYKSGSAIGYWDLESGTEIDRIVTSRAIPHGVVATADGAYSFVSVEGIGGEAGALEIYDNETRCRLGSVDVGKQAGGLVLWKGR